MSSAASVRTFMSSSMFAVVGASSNPSKYGHTVFAWYKAHGLPVVPVNPGTASVTVGDQSYPTVPHVRDLPGLAAPSTVSISIVTPPAVTLETLQQAHDAGVAAVWMQPGSFDDAALDYARQLGRFRAVVAGDGGCGYEGWCILLDGEAGLAAVENL